MDALQQQSTARPLVRTPQSQAAPGRTSPALLGGGTVPPVTSFLRSLRLLDLDLLPDWPGISVDTFAATAANTGVQAQKRRIRCVEWALFRLFTLWDPEMAAGKLKPFFPPLNQIQSLSLRAALLRALEQAKKMGVLGRDAVIRKTMLDECKGERLEEVLANFSMAILRKMTAAHIESGNTCPSVAVGLALENKGLAVDDAQLSLLTMAHKADLRRFIARKEVARARYCHFAEFLAAKEHDLARRDEEICAKEKDGVEKYPGHHGDDMRQTVRNNWHGDERWMNTLLLGHSGLSVGGIQDASFGSIWQRVQQGELDELDDDNGSLLKQLDDRVRLQKERLARWDTFRRKMHQNRAQISPPICTSPERKGSVCIGIKFDAHQHLQIQSPTLPRSTVPGMQMITVADEYKQLMDELTKELAEIRCRKPHTMAFLESRPTWSIDRIKNKSNSESEILDPEDKPEGFSKKLTSRTTTSSRPVIDHLPHPGEAQTEHEFYPSTDATSHRIAQVKGESESEMVDASHHQNLWDACSPPSPSPAPQTSLPWDPIEVQGTRMQAQKPADRMRKSMDSAPSSPTESLKPLQSLSLAQRTRLSMAKISSTFEDTGELEQPPASNPTFGRTDALNFSAKKPSSAVDDGVEPGDDLIARTRRSMVGIEKAKQKAQLERHRSLQKSKVSSRREGNCFPVVHEDSKDVTMLTEQMLREEDMESVFRSRPRVKTSPPASPTKW
ncbi:hypothetical protein DCS_04430 [Drechmeria coniospora]|uniref:HAUS augmin-like complex subunit 6 N-terminal domain-containing protein n=1 Tax=Drechmeria coniospora TaxID=98403 RepID=A0A151GK54_DRECN|nr:hypothetical protein DCS_04430 [Drechmeria coniospora]KYK57421.1 hypothetical protein DCS_04430 [Drechmeria coniospora]ODA79323.1 hypothetical protein RJ55_04916 [Drechmeria coniospora]